MPTLSAHKKIVKIRKYVLTFFFITPFHKLYDEYRKETLRKQKGELLKDSPLFEYKPIYF